MLIVFLVATIALIVVGATISKKGYSYEVGGIFTSVLAAFMAIGILILIGVTWANVVELKVIDEKIAMYEEENASIEAQIAEVVEQYQQYEIDIYTSVSPETAMTLVSLYPDLKSDTLVQSQIELYVQNNAHIKTLREKKINGDVSKWWLYFGGK